MVPPSPGAAVETALDVVGVGNALVDVIAPCDDAFLEEHGLVRGSMALVTAEEAEALYGVMGPAVEISGGSAANTLAGLAGLGARCGFVGRVGRDALGEVFAHDLATLGVELALAPALDGSPTGRSLIVVPPDAQRAMSTLLGAAADLSPGDIDEALVERAWVTYLEGYLFDRDAAQLAFYQAAGAAHRAGRRVALTLSDSFCVERWRPQMRALVAGQVDIVFGNEDELLLLYEADDVEEALAQALADCDLVVLTRGAAGSTVAAGSERHDVPAARVERVQDTTGAGDLYAAGFLFGLTRGADLGTCGRLGAAVAAEVVSHFGARPEASLAELVAPLLVAGSP